MSIGERIRFLRNLRGMTQKSLGLLMHFPENAADVRVAQYESGTRKPKEDVTEKLAELLDVSPRALNVPMIDNAFGVAHTFFALQDKYGLEPVEVEGCTYLRLNPRNMKGLLSLEPVLDAWLNMTTKLKTGEITQEEYDQWRYHYPDRGLGAPSNAITARIPSAYISDLLTEAYHEQQKQKKQGKKKK